MTSEGSVRRVVLVVPDDVAAPTGGNRYDRALAGALREAGTDVVERRAPGRWPAAAAGDRQRLAEVMRGPGDVLVDGLLACGAPDAVADAVAGGHRVHVLLHLPLALETGLDPGTARRLDALERRALHAATGVIATSHWAASHLSRHHGIADVAVAVPGTEPAPVATGSTPPRLLQLAAVTPRKDQLGVVEALARVSDLPWTARLVGPLDRDPAYTAAVRAAIDDHRLAGRIVLTGPLTGTALLQEWEAVDLLVLPSLAETFGMAVTEALSRGIPAVVGVGTGAQEALGSAPDGCVPGALVPPGDLVALAGALRELLSTDGTLGIARSRARARRRHLTPWRLTAEQVVSALQAGSETVRR